MKRDHLWADHERRAPSYHDVKEGAYAWPVSLAPGEVLSLHVSNSRPRYDVTLFREGATREVVDVVRDLEGCLQPIPADASAHGCRWDATFSYRIPESWTSGVYVAAFPTSEGPREALFVVRAAEPSSPLLLTLGLNTYQAYNNVGGKCFYDYISTDRQRSRQLSFQRPWQPSSLGGFQFWDQHFISWLESSGFTVDYCTNLDHDRDPRLLDAYRANLRIGHDEYNTRNECRQLQRFVRRGGNLLVFSGNAFWHLVELDTQRGTIACDKTSRYPRPGESLTPADTSLLCAIDNLRQDTIGVFATAFVHTKTDVPGTYRAATTDGRFGDFRVMQEDHWAFAGTGLRSGDAFGGEDSIVGVETDAPMIEFVEGRPRPTGEDGVSPHYEILALADAGADEAFVDLGVRFREAQGEATAWGSIVINETEHAGTVFNAATIDWSHGLHREGAVAQITRNVLDRLAFRDQAAGRAAPSATEEVRDG